MKKYRSSKAYSSEIDIYESTDPVDADTVDNVPLKQLANNTAYNKEMHERMGLTVKGGKLCITWGGSGGGGGGIDPSDIATDEDVEQMIENLNDL